MTQWTALNVADEFVFAMKELGMDEPTPVQEQAIPRQLAGDNLVVTAPTGTGKTLAFLAPLFSRLDSSRAETQAVILAPTYELCIQISGVLQKLAEAGAGSLKVQQLIGGANISRQIEKLKKKPHIIVGSPGRIIELARMKKLKLGNVKVLILDEFDRMLDDQNLTILADMMKLLPTVEKLQTLCFSATASPKALERVSFLGEPEHLVVGGKLAMPEGISHYIRQCAFREKIDNIRRLTRSLEVKRGLVFIGRSSNVDWVSGKLTYEGLKIASLIGRQDKQERQSAVAALKSGKARLLLTTDIAARGLDIPDVDVVFNLDMPDTAAMYLHRAGRTGRAGAKGIVVTMLDPREKEKFQTIARKLNIRPELLKGI